MGKIIVIDDTKAILKVLKDILEMSGHVVDTADSAEAGLELIRANRYDLIISDVRLSGMDGMQLLSIVKAEYPDIPFLIISGHANISMAIDAIKKGAFNVLEKPIDMNTLLRQVKYGIESNSTSSGNTKDKPSSTRSRRSKNNDAPMIGESMKMQIVKDMIGRASLSNVKVLILGNNGTGKELVAREIHTKSSRSDRPFIAINCAAIPCDLIESELFGHEKGSFTGAYKQKKGLFELASTGSIFMDEIGDMSLAAQAKVLRVLQESKITRVGGDKSIDIDVRVIAATNKNLTEEIKKGNFREDLYHRLSVVIIRVPTLNDRVDDIPMLSNYFLAKLCTQYNVELKTYTDGAMEMLKSHNWSGNVRELINITERLVVFCGDEINEKDINRYVNEQYDQLA